MEIKNDLNLDLESLKKQFPNYSDYTYFCLRAGLQHFAAAIAEMDKTSKFEVIKYLPKFLGNMVNVMVNYVETIDTDPEWEWLKNEHPDSETSSSSSQAINKASDSEAGATHPEN